VTQASSVLGDDELLAQTRSGTVSYDLSDGQNNVRLLTDANGAITDSYRYDAFGTALSSQGTTVNPYRYTGQQLDSLTGLYDLRARYYDPTSGRFLSRDTAGIDVNNPVEVNRYTYVTDNPINFADPSGNAEIEEETQILGADELATAPLRPSPVLPDEPLAPPHWLAVLLALVTFLAWLWGEIRALPPGPTLLPLPAPAPVLQIPPVGTDNDDTRGEVDVYRKVDGKLNSNKTKYTNPSLNPGAFKLGPDDTDGLSTFEWNNVPGDRPYMVRFTIVYKPPKMWHTPGDIVGLPCTAIYTPDIAPGHWSINCLGDIGPLLSKYARTFCVNVVFLNPHWGLDPQKRDLDCSRIPA
jgi:RHS repeat-associated protein